jgi:hypothetical protein
MAEPSVVSSLTTKVVLKCPEMRIPFTRLSALKFMVDYKKYYQQGGDVHITRAISEEGLRLVGLTQDSVSMLGDIDSVY